MTPYKLKDLGELCKSLEVIINSLNLIIDLKNCVCKFCNLDVLETTRHSVVIVMFGDDSSKMSQKSIDSKRILV